jgi:hypothetical protein
VKIEFLADQPDIPDQVAVSFEQCESLGAVNLRGTGFASQDYDVRTITVENDGTPVSVELRVATLPAYLLAKAHAARGRGLEKDWYDIAYVLLHNDVGGPGAAAARTRDRFGDMLVGGTETALSEVVANFADADAQGSVAYATTMIAVNPDLDFDILANDAVAAVAEFGGRLGIGT